MLEQRRAIATTPRNAFLLACALAPWVAAALWTAWSRRDELADRLIRIVDYASD